MGLLAGHARRCERCGVRRLAKTCTFCGHVSTTRASLSATGLISPRQLLQQFARPALGPQPDVRGRQLDFTTRSDGGILNAPVVLRLWTLRGQIDPGDRCPRPNLKIAITSEHALGSTYDANLVHLFDLHLDDDLNVSSHTRELGLDGPFCQQCLQMLKHVCFPSGRYDP